MRELTEEEKAERREMDAMIKTVRKEAFEKGYYIGSAVSIVIYSMLLFIIF